MRRLRDYGEHLTSRGVEINMAPMIDMVFLLLIFFISTTVFVQESGVEIQKPQAVSAAPVAKDSIMIALTADGQIVYGGRQLDLNALRGIVAQQIREHNVPVIILADDRSNTGRLMDVIDECKLAGARQVSLAAMHEGPGS